jgi:hypothetical protein
LLESHRQKNASSHVPAATDAGVGQYRGDIRFLNIMLDCMQKILPVNLDHLSLFDLYITFVDFIQQDVFVAVRKLSVLDLRLLNGHHLLPFNVLTDLQRTMDVVAMYKLT